MAYIYARSKSGKPFKMGIEDKHIYHNYSEAGLYVGKNLKNDSTTEMTTSNPYCINSSKLASYNITGGFVVPRGTDENQRVGNKVFLKFIDITYEIRMSPTSYINSFSHGQAIDAYFRCRVMVVQFDAGKTETDLADWFRDTYTYFSTRAIHNDTAPLQSVHTAKLRESTTHTGAFRILYDKKICIKKNKTVKMSTIRLPIKMNVNFENDYNKPTDESMKNIYLIVIGPCYNEVDMDTISYDKTASIAADTLLFYTGCVAKYEYYDL